MNDPLHQPSQESLEFRANIARLLSPLRRVRPSIPFFQLAAHRTPTLWTLYRGLLREAPTEDIRYRVTMLFRKNQHLTGTDATKKKLEKGYKYLDAFKRANAGDTKQQAILSRYSRALSTKYEKEYWKHLMRNEIAWRRKLANRPILTGGYLRPSYANGPLPRLNPQPIAISGMIRKRRIAWLRRSEKLVEVNEMLRHLRSEAKFEGALAKFAQKKHYEFSPVFASYEDEWAQPLLEQKRDIEETFRRNIRRNNEPYPPEMLEAIKNARREKIANKTRERERERRGEILSSTILRRRKGPPAHVLAVMTPERRKLDKVARSASEVGYVALAKRKLGFKPQNPDTWKMEAGAPENKKWLDNMSKDIRDENERRMKIFWDRQEDEGGTRPSNTASQHRLVS